MTEDTNSVEMDDLGDKSVENTQLEPHKSTENPLEVDPVTSTVGAVGRWQVIVCVAVALTKTPIAWHQLGILFLAPVANFKCRNDERVCPENCTEYDYETSVFNKTIVSEWDLVCDRSWMKDLHQSVFMLGVLVGNMVFGILGDRYGRRWPLLIAVAIQFILGTSAAYSMDWYTFTTLRFFFALCNGGTMVISFVIVMETIGVKYRQIFGVIYHIPFILGHASLAGIAYLTRDSWRNLQLWISLPTAVLLIFYWIIPESPRWLIIKGRSGEAVHILKKAAQMNRMPTEDVDEKINNIIERTEREKSSRNIMDLFRNRNLRKRTLLLCYGWLSCGICFYGLSQHISHLSGDIFLNVTISALIQLPGNMIAMAINHIFGRKKSQFGSYLIAGFFLISISIVPESSSTLRIVFSLLGMVGISLAFPTIYLFSGEIFPTTLRNTGMGLCTVISRIGPMISPFIADLYKYKYWLPPLIFGCLPLVAAFTVLILPETHGKELPTTIEDAENFGNERKT